MNWYNLFKYADGWPVGIEDTIIEMYTKPDPFGKYKSVNDIAKEMHADRHMIDEILKRRGVPRRSADAGRKPFMNIDKLPEMTGVIKDFKYLYERAQKPLSDNSLQRITQILGQKYGANGETILKFLKDNIPGFEQMTPKIIGRKRKMNEDISTKIIKAYQNGYSAGKIADFLGKNVTTILSVLQRTGVIRSTTDTVALKNSLRNKKIPSLQEIFQPNTKEAFM